MIPRRLTAAPPGWTATAEVVVVGSGIAGLTAALQCRAALRVRGDNDARVLLVTKALLDAGSTRWAQGGIAAALSDDDSPAAHFTDTVTAGAGLCDPAAVRVLVDEGPARVRDLAALGAAFDRDPAGVLELTREGGHLHRRIVHAGGDATGLEVERALLAAVAAVDIEVIEHALVLDLLTDAGGAACGVTLHVLGEGTRDGVGAVRARAVVLATGGMGQIYASTTNPDVSTGDGVALALRAGAVLADLEFVQFHPTALFSAAAGTTGRQPLVTEALRGEGAILVDAHGAHVMADVHPLADLAPRDVVAKQMSRVMAAQGVDHLYLDARALGTQLLHRRFPTLVANCAELGIDPAVDPVPVAPAAHYASGGVRTDLHGRTAVAGLFACGEVACTGVHGANRLASNSLLEGLVFATRLAAVIGASLPEPGPPTDLPTAPGLVDGSARGELQRAMTDGAGVLRSADSLAAAAKTLDGLAERGAGAAGPDSWETTNLLTIATALVAAATQREETRGCHWREDFADRDDDKWRVRWLSRLEGDGRLTGSTEPADSTGEAP
ncbi:MAG: L-aspartate oxidase, partial [Frankiaceae bacterium]|nr:L-aspartate oxidase [Frankiaceae bacterium]